MLLTLISDLSTKVSSFSSASFTCTRLLIALRVTSKMAAQDQRLSDMRCCFLIAASQAEVAADVSYGADGRQPCNIYNVLSNACAAPSVRHRIETAGSTGHMA
jgi:hypothetical protein